MEAREEQGTGRTTADRGHLPTFLIIGAMKAGTTSLNAYLESHPQVFMSKKKDSNYFSERIAGGESLEWYRRLFKRTDGATAIGEASNSYTKFPTYPETATRIAAVLPDVRLIYLVRHPIERMRSQWLHVVARGQESRSIERALAEDPMYVYNSMYALQLEQYLAHFDRDRILILRSENLYDSRKATLESVFKFIGVDSDWSSPVMDVEFGKSASKRRPAPLARRLRSTFAYRAALSKGPRFLTTFHRRFMTRAIDPSSTVIPDALRRHLEDLLRDDIEGLRALLGHDFDGWELI
jgi:hypothetical protein